ncbi:hypothetical protein TRFO_34964 [Tritrichomonas foetus]|uniref:RING-type domain-containing protein n=1 Tax=Tritrichomonas foetus TaxID=1144522 RepID=A0A1J4JM73_9EUKA|nr:hypothetical protein TRFO_34964 [Tritrichomonas foetus]|eukprot:OHS98629.1 hypothetical protein TRFO_34964 [Tritrichomonas foetus]
MSFFFFNETTFNNCDPFPPFISANSNYIVFLNYHNISIYPISSFVIEENRNKFDFLILSNRKIEGILNCSNNNDLYVNLYNKSVQFILTQFYIIIFSKYYILAISLETGNVAIRYPFRDMVIESIFPDDVNNSFYIITNKNVFQGHILFENNSINAHPINIERESMLKQNITHYCNFNYALLYYLKNHNYHFALNLIKEKLHKSNDIIYHVILQFLYDEITIISGISQSQIFIESQDLDIDMFLKNLYIRHLRYLDQTNILKLSHKIFIESFKSESLIYEMINQKLFSQDLLFSMIQLKNQSYFQSMAIIDSKTFLKSMNHFTFPIEKIFQSLLLLSKFINSETIIKYIDYFIERNKFSLFMEIILMGKCEQNLICNIDEIIYQIINRIYVELLDPIGILEKCKSKGFYKTGYLLAMRNNMHYIAKQCAKKSKDRKLIYDMENHFNIIYGNNYLIKSLEENHKVSLKDKLKQKGNTQIAIANELRNVNKEIKITRNQIKKEAQQFAYMKKELKKEDASKSSINTSFFCSNCKLMIHEKEYIEMPCGHIFHIQCMKKLLKMLGIIVTNDYEIFDKMANKTQNDDIDLNNMLFQDCPMCGMISTQICSEHYIFANKWNYDININETKSDLF